MKYPILILLLICITYFVKAQNKPASGDISSPSKALHMLLQPLPYTIIALKDVNLYVGKFVSITAVVYGHKILDNLELFALGGAYPNETLSIIAGGKAFKKFKDMDIDGKTITITGIIEKRSEYQLYIDNPFSLFIVPKR